jgi:RNA 3'-terminal phosphate cyclase (ATP)
VEYDHVGEVFTGFGEPARPAEAVAMHAVQQYQKYIKNSAPVGEYLTDQLMLPLAIAGAGSFRTAGLSRHAQTHLELIREFLGPQAVQATKTDDGTVVTFGESIVHR